MRPEFVYLQFTPDCLRLPRQCQQLNAYRESIRHVAENLDRNFASAALRFHHAGQRNELTTCFRIANGPVPCPGADSSLFFSVLSR